MKISFDMAKQFIAAVVLIKGIVGPSLPQETFSNNWRHLKLSQLRRGVATGTSWHLEGRGQGCCSTSFNAEDSCLQQRIKQNVSSCQG